MAHKTPHSIQNGAKNKREPAKTQIGRCHFVVSFFLSSSVRLALQGVGGPPFFVRSCFYSLPLLRPSSFSIYVQTARAPHSVVAHQSLLVLLFFTAPPPSFTLPHHTTTPPTLLRGVALASARGPSSSHTSSPFPAGGATCPFQPPPPIPPARPRARCLPPPAYNSVPLSFPSGAMDG